MGEGLPIYEEWEIDPNIQGMSRDSTEVVFYAYSLKL